MAIPIIDPRMVSVRGLRLCSLDITADRKFAIGNVAERSAEDDHDADQTRETDESEADVRAREEIPGLHVSLID